MTDRAGASAVLILDGGTATELQRRGAEVDAPWWTSLVLRSQAGRALIRQVHADFIAAGARIITANTFRTSRHSLDAAGASEQEADELVRVALAEARAARAQAPTATQQVTIAASVAPLGDCFLPEQVPPSDVLRAEHRWHIERLAGSGAELLLAETMNSIREAVTVVAEGKRSGLPVWASFACTGSGRLLSGENAPAAALAAGAAGADAVLVNCTSLTGCAAALADIRAGGADMPLGCYPNIEDRSGIPQARHVNRYVKSAYSPGSLAVAMAGLTADFGLAVVGGCCGASPRHIRAITQAFTQPAGGTSPPASISSDRIRENLRSNASANWK
jgi:enediyne biosynthesis protein CalE2